jgi:hypothetical protein
MKALYVASIGGADQLRGWFVTSHGDPGARLHPHYHGAAGELGHRRLHGARRCRPSELSFDGLVEAIRAAWRANPTLGGRPGGAGGER